MQQYNQLHNASAGRCKSKSRCRSRSKCKCKCKCKQDRTGYNTCKLGKCQKADGTNEATANFNLSMR